MSGAIAGGCASVEDGRVNAESMRSLILRQPRCQAGLVPAMTHTAKGTNCERLYIIPIAGRPCQQAARLGKALVHQRFANEIDTAEQRFTLAKPAENIVVQDVVAITASMSRTRQHPAWTNWDDSITSVAHERSQITLAQLLESFQKTNEH